MKKGFLEEALQLEEKHIKRIEEIRFSEKTEAEEVLKDHYNNA